MIVATLLPKTLVMKNNGRVDDLELQAFSAELLDQDPQDVRARWATP